MLLLSAAPEQRWQLPVPAAPSPELQGLGLSEPLMAVLQRRGLGSREAIENLLERGPLLNPPPVRAISDQFASSKTTVERALMTLGKGIELVQRHRAEEDMAVAAASIVARNEYLQRMKNLEKEFSMPLLRGASAAVEEAARKLVERHGSEVLPRVSKMHFRTRYRVLGEAEPAKNPWKKPIQTSQPEK